MNVLIIGNGGREHALAWKISQSKILNKLYIAPGNPGTENVGENVNISDFDSILKFSKEKNIDLIIVGPEKPLVDGIADYLRENDILVFGPSKKAARLEGEKVFAKKIMKKYNIPTADFKIFNKEQYKEAITYLAHCNYPIVVKASGLAAGKGVSICENFNQADISLKDCFFEQKFGNSGNTVLIEEYLTGEEVSIFAITDGERYFVLPPSQDHKQIYDGDKGPNTGGMGAYAPAPIVNKEMLKIIENKIINPTIYAMKKENSEFVGCLYCGLMITNDGPKVIEYNCRFGDPEIEAVVMTINGDFLELLYSTAKGKIDKNSVKYNGGASVCVVAASDGYPKSYKTGFEITGFQNVENENIEIFHSGTRKLDDKIYTNGGRVIAVTSFVKDNNITKSKENAYEALSKINFEGIYYRKDISDKAFLKSKIE